MVQGSHYCHNCGEKVESLEKVKVDLIKDQEVNIAATDDVEINYAGTSINESVEMSNHSNEALDYKDNRKRTVKKKIIKLATSIIVISVLAIGCFYGLPYMKYKHAKSLMAEKKYGKAISAFIEFEDYNNSKELVVESKYLYTKQLIESKDYNQAREVIDTLHYTYKDSNTVRLEIDYLRGKQCLRSKEYLKAINFFNASISFKDSKQLSIKSRYLYGKELADQKNYPEAISYFEGIKGYEDTNTLLAETRYLGGIAKYESGNFDDAEALFLANKEDYKDTETYLSNMAVLKQFNGTWESEYGSSQLIFSGINVTIVYFPNSPKTKTYTSEIEVEYAYTVKDSYGTTYSLTKNHLYEEYDDNYNWEAEEYSKVSDHTFIPEEKQPPRIGMTASEVRSSNWGSPKDINKTTNAYGVSEQWVYDDYKYIYLDDGVVTSIQE